MGQSKILVLRIVWFSMLMSVLIMGYALKVMSGNWEPAETVVDEIVKILAFVATIAAVMSFVLPKMIAKSLKIQVPDSMDKKILYYFMPFVLMLVFSESVALFGFVISFMKTNVNYYPPFMVASIVLILLRYPTEAKVNSFFNSNI